ncbi:MAG TPA: hypothetical protein VGD97_04760 [Lacunisphaera sp.]
MPLLLSLFLFGYFTLLGRSVMVALKYEAPVLRGWLASPTVGLAVVTLGIMVLNQAGWPIRDFALPLLAGGLLFSAAVGVWRRPCLPVRALLPFAGVLVISLLYSAWPALLTGFDWVAQANDDMANYCLGAQRMLNHGFFRAPTEAELAGLDYSQYYWFLHVVSLIRFGSEMLLAWVAGWSGHSPLQVFMPVIAALSLVQVSATAALVLAAGPHRRRALGAAALLALSPLFLLSIYYQLIAQVGGVALLLGFCALACTARPARSLVPQARLGIILGIQAAGLCVFYPEVTPFVGLGYAVFVSREALRLRRIPRARLVVPAVGVVVALVLLHYNFLSYIVTLVHQVYGHPGSAAWVRFPFYLLPLGPGYTFGFLPMPGTIPEPWNSLMVLAGLAVAVTVTIQALRACWRGTAYGCVLVVMLGVAGTLFWQRNGFGLFKITMFAQPLLACTLAGLFFRPARRWVGLSAMLLFVALQLPTARTYMLGSVGQAPDRLLEMPGISFSRISLPPADSAEPLVTGINNPVANKLAASLTTGRPLHFLSFDYFAQLLGTLNLSFGAPSEFVFKYYPHAAETMEAARRLTDDQSARRRVGRLFATRFYYSPTPDAPATGYLGLQPPADLLNQMHASPGTEGKVFYVQPRARMANHLVFVPSSRGEHYYTMEDPRTTSFYQVERDFFNPGRYFSSLGRFMLLRVENPSDQVYLKVSLTKSVMGRGRTRLNLPAKVLGRETLAAGFTGAGSASVFVGPLQPVTLHGASYLAVDFGQAGQRVDRSRSGVMAWYNAEVLLDWRELVAYGRDISCLSVEEYRRLPRPLRLEHFPHDLFQGAGVEFSGWFEDGWISTESYVVLGAAGTGDHLALRGSIPSLGPLADAGQELSIRINDAPPQTFALPPGNFDLNVPIRSTETVTRVRLSFVRETALPGDDGRPIAAKIDFLGLIRD